MTTTAPTDIWAELAERKRRGQTADQLAKVGHRTGWWNDDDIDWLFEGTGGPRPAGWTLADGAVVTTAEPVTLQSLAELNHADRGHTGGAFAAGGVLAEAAASTKLDGDTQVLEGSVVVSEHPAEPTCYVHVVRVDQAFVDTSYQRDLDQVRAREMARDWNPRRVSVIDVSDRGEQVDPTQRYAVINGQHRWAAARLAGVEQLVATIHEGLTVPAEADLMYELDRGTKPLSSWDKWKARRVAGDPVVAGVEQLVASVGMSVHSHAFGAVGAAEKIVRSRGKGHLGSVAVILTSGWGPVADAVKAPMLTGASAALHRHGNALDVNRLVAALRRTTPQALRHRADSIREVDGCTLAAAVERALVGAYNASATYGRLSTS